MVRVLIGSQIAECHVVISGLLFAATVPSETADSDRKPENACSRSHNYSFTLDRKALAVIYLRHAPELNHFSVESLGMPRRNRCLLANAPCDIHPPKYPFPLASSSRSFRYSHSAGQPALISG